MVGLVETMLKLHKAKTPCELEPLRRTIEVTDKQIDASVYELCRPAKGTIMVLVWTDI